MNKILLPSLLAFGFVVGSPLAAQAQNVQFVEPMTTESGASIHMEDNALNYFATSAEERKAVEAQKAAAPEGHVPASELEYLPEELELGGKARLKVEGGRILSHTEASGQAYNYCDDYTARGEAMPDGCIQKNGSEPSGNMAVPREQATAPAPAYEQPQTLDAQLEARGQTAPEPVAVDASTQVQTHINAGVASSGANIGNTAVIDRARGSKTNIISNTDTGVKLDY